MSLPRQDGAGRISDFLRPFRFSGFPWRRCRGRRKSRSSSLGSCSMGKAVAGPRSGAGIQKLAVPAHKRFPRDSPDGADVRGLDAHPLEDRRETSGSGRTARTTVRPKSSPGPIQPLQSLISTSRALRTPWTKTGSFLRFLLAPRPFRHFASTEKSTSTRPASYTASAASRAKFFGSSSSVWKISFGFDFPFSFQVRSA